MPSRLRALISAFRINATAPKLPEDIGTPTLVACLMEAVFQLEREVEELNRRVRSAEGDASDAINRLRRNGLR